MCIRDRVTAKDKKLDTAALGLVIVEEGGSSLLSRRIVDDDGSNDGMLDALILAPRSRMEICLLYTSRCV